MKQVVIALYRNSLSLQVGNVEQGSVEVDTLEEIHLGDEGVIVISLGAVKLCGRYKMSGGVKFPHCSLRE